MSRKRTLAPRSRNIPHAYFEYGQHQELDILFGAGKGTPLTAGQAMRMIWDLATAGATRDFRFNAILDAIEDDARRYK